MGLPSRFLAVGIVVAGATGPAVLVPVARAAPAPADAAVVSAVLPSSSLVLRAAADASGVYAYAVDAASGTRALLCRRPDGAVEKLAEGPRIEQIVLDDERAYWVGEDGVQAVPKAGGPVQYLAARDWTLLPLATDPARWALAVDGDEVFFSLDDGVGRVAKAGGAAELLASVPSGRGATLVGVDASDVWWLENVPAEAADGGDGDEPPTADLFATPKGGGDARRLLHGLVGLRAMVVDPDGVYWLDGTEDRGAIHRASKTTGDVVTLAADVAVYYDRVLAVDGGRLFWLDYPHGLHGPMRVQTTPKSGGGAVETIVETFPPANKLALTEDRIYWAQQGVASVASPVARAVLRGSPVGR